MLAHDASPPHHARATAEIRAPSNSAHAKEPSSGDIRRIAPKAGGRYGPLRLATHRVINSERSSGINDAMLDPKIFEEFSARLGAIIAASPAADIEKNARALLSSFFTKLDLVSREEFDIQAQVLQRTREKLKDLEARVTALESRNQNDA